MHFVRFGIIILADQRWQEAARRWHRAEEYGFDHAWTYDHLGWHRLLDDTWFDAVPTLTAAATVTSRIRLGTLVASPNFRHPVSFARQITALDDISAGRLVLGLGAGAGGGSYDARVLGLPALTVTERADRFAEFAELLDLLLREDAVTWHGRYYDAVGARNLPGCLQRPRVPFVLAADDPRSVALAARLGDGWVTTGHWQRVRDADSWWTALADGVRRFDEALNEAGREASRVRKYLFIDASGHYALSSEAYFTDAVGRAGELGFTDVITHWPRPTGMFAGSEAVLDAVAAGVLSRQPQDSTPGAG
jgi:alkanesulfonate monooxygenase SsuD/methylene tetrahydromethanopterin reductase-like flavin-dependent oxidoreductase (luciferase family)